MAIFLAGMILGQGAGVFIAVAEPRAPVVEGDVQRGILLGPAARGDTQKQPPARDYFYRGCGLGHMRRMAQRQDDTGDAKRDVLRRHRQSAQIDERVEQLACIAEGRHVERHIAQPERRKPLRIGQLGAFELARQVGHRVVAMCIQRHHQTDADASGTKDGVGCAVIMLASAISACLPDQSVIWRSGVMP